MEVSEDLAEEVSSRFFPSAQARGLEVDEMFSPSLLDQVSYAGKLRKSFRPSDDAIDKLLDNSLRHKRLERITELIGAERLVEADPEAVTIKTLRTVRQIILPAAWFEGQFTVHAREAEHLIFDRVGFVRDQTRQSSSPV